MTSIKILKYLTIKNNKILKLINEINNKNK